MAILTETYSAKTVVDRVSISKQEWMKEDSKLAQESRETNRRLGTVDRIHKVNGVLQTNPEYLKLYGDIQGFNEERTKLKAQVRDADKILRRLEDIRTNRKHKDEFDELTVELTMKQRIMYGFEKGSDLHGV